MTAKFRALTAFLLGLAGVGFAADAAVTPITRAHAHNDYEHTRPLFDALDQGFNSVEADIFLVDGKLLVGHTALSLKPERTLESLYLDPMRDRVRANGGRLHKDGPPAWLLIDVKTEANSTYAALDKVLAKYADVLTSIDGDRVDKKAITVVVSGNMAKAAMEKQQRRYAGYDGRAPEVDSDIPASLMPWVSDNWTKLFQWRGDGKMSGEERAKLNDFVTRAHKHGRLVRFWATPEKPEFWAELRAADVDLINTDQLAELRKFLVGNGK
ncbi:MAG TPA: phosphatidylinositol-specific phospholipase C/glycerophosphodiester phosphodiesterase family protein [Gemmataceae bacterium]|nr:phosphatidylinositol-specific phospholipase C/glycerophosphodiester phosphodiesterase family protein [Gemmataceae bacterium]